MGSNEHLVVRDDGILVFYGTPRDKFCPVWNDDDATFCLFMSEKKCWIGTNSNGAELFMTTKEEEKANFWVHELDKDGFVSLLFHVDQHRRIVCPLQENGLSGLSFNRRTLLLKFHQ